MASGIIFLPIVAVLFWAPILSWPYLRTSAQKEHDYFSHDRTKILVFYAVVITVYLSTFALFSHETWSNSSRWGLWRQIKLTFLYNYFWLIPLICFVIEFILAVYWLITEKSLLFTNLFIGANLYIASFPFYIIWFVLRELR